MGGSGGTGIPRGVRASGGSSVGRPFPGFNGLWSEIRVRVLLVHLGLRFPCGCWVLWLRTVQPCRLRGVGFRPHCSVGADAARGGLQAGQAPAAHAGPGAAGLCASLEQPRRMHGTPSRRRPEHMTHREPSALLVQSSGDEPFISTGSFPELLKA